MGEPGPVRAVWVALSYRSDCLLVLLMSDGASALPAQVIWTSVFALLRHLGFHRELRRVVCQPRDCLSGPLPWHAVERRGVHITPIVQQRAEQRVPG